MSEWIMEKFYFMNISYSVPWKLTYENNHSQAMFHRTRVIVTHAWSSKRAWRQPSSSHRHVGCHLPSPCAPSDELKLQWAWLYHPGLTLGKVLGSHDWWPDWEWKDHCDPSNTACVQQRLKPTLLDLLHRGDVYLHTEWEKKQLFALEKVCF